MSSVSLPTGRWVLGSAQEGISSLRYEPDATFTADQIGPEEVLVEIRAASLNQRELAICMASQRLRKAPHFASYSDADVEPVSNSPERAIHPAPFLFQQRQT